MIIEEFGNHLITERDFLKHEKGEEKANL